MAVAFKGGGGRAYNIDVNKLKVATNELFKFIFSRKDYTLGVIFIMIIV